MSIIFCPECSNEISDKAITCPKCGLQVKKIKFCTECSNYYVAKKSICPNCGKKNIKKNKFFIPFILIFTLVIILFPVITVKTKFPVSRKTDQKNSKNIDGIFGCYFGESNKKVINNLKKEGWTLINNEDDEYIFTKDTNYMNLDVAFIAVKFNKKRLYNIAVFTKNVSTTLLESTIRRISSTFEYVDVDNDYDSRGNPTVTIRDIEDNILTIGLADNSVLLMFMSHKYSD